jgi:hypothetical protein
MNEDQARALVHGMAHGVMDEMLDRNDQVRTILQLGEDLYDDLVDAGIGGVTAASAVAGLLQGRMMARMAGADPIESTDE